MKKSFSIFLVLLFVVVSLANINLRNGVYRAESLEISRDWMDFVELTIENGKIVKVVNDSYNVSTGLFKSNDKGYWDRMGMDLSKVYEKLTNDLVNKQNINEVDTITGATSSVNAFKSLVQAILERGIPNNTIVVNTSKYNLRDGVYRAEGVQPIHGWTDFLEVTIKNGMVVEAKADAFNAAGNLKTNDAGYASRMGMDPKEFYSELSQRLINAQKPSGIDTITGATSSSNYVRYLYLAILHKGQPERTIKVDFSKFAAFSLKDGIYRAEYAQPVHGWTDFLEITVKNGIIVKAYADAFNTAGNLKTNDPNYGARMGMEPKRFYGILSYRIIAEQVPSGVDTLSGATSSSNSVRALLNAIIQRGEAGKVIKIN
jgi:major membrane immunogen (membrane-anchored lipoprotein)